MRIKLMVIRMVGAGVASLAIGAAAHASTVVISNTGPFSTNVATVSSSTTVTRFNFNTVGVTNSNSQSATSGSASSFFNTNGGFAMSGAANNWNSGSTWVSVSN